MSINRGERVRQIGKLTKLWITTNVCLYFVGHRRSSKQSKAQDKRVRCQHVLIQSFLIIILRYASSSRQHRAFNMQLVPVHIIVYVVNI